MLYTYTDKAVRTGSGKCSRNSIIFLDNDRIYKQEDISVGKMCITKCEYTIACYKVYS